MDYIITYSVKDNNSRSRLRKLLEKAGYRVMRSTYIVNLRRHQVKKMYKKISDIVNEEDDVLFIRQCASCKTKARRNAKKDYKKFYFF